MLRLDSLPHSATCLLGAVFARKQAIPAEDDLPGLALRIERVKPDSAHIAAYRKAFGFVASVPLAWLYLPVQRAQLVLINQKHFPLRAAGLIHVANTIEQVDEFALTLPMAIAISLGEQSKRRSGRQFELITRIEQGGREVARMSSRYLAPAPRIRGASRKPAGPAPATGPVLSTIDASPAYGWRYARLSGDWNPIHLHPWLARSFGLRRPIAHGMAVAAAALAALEAERGASARRFEVEFLKPVPLPSQLDCESAPAEGEDLARAQLRLAGEVVQRVTARFSL